MKTFSNSQVKNMAAYLLYLFCKLSLKVVRRRSIFSSVSSMIFPVVPLPRNFINPVAVVNESTSLLLEQRELEKTDDYHYTKVLGLGHLLTALRHQPNNSRQVE